MNAPTWVMSNVFHGENTPGNSLQHTFWWYWASVQKEFRLPWKHNYHISHSYQLNRATHQINFALRRCLLHEHVIVMHQLRFYYVLSQLVDKYYPSHFITLSILVISQRAIINILPVFWRINNKNGANTSGQLAAVLRPYQIIWYLHQIGYAKIAWKNFFPITFYGHISVTEWMLNSERKQWHLENMSHLRVWGIRGHTCLYATPYFTVIDHPSHCTLHKYVCKYCKRADILFPAETKKSQAPFCNYFQPNNWAPHEDASKPAKSIPLCDVYAQSEI